jgi:hypothetical protein
VLPYLLRRGGSLDAFVLSHPHTDHVGGAASVLTAMRPHAYWDAAFAGGSDAYIASLAAARKQGIEWHRVHPGDSIRIDGVVVSFLAPDSAWTVGLKDPNLASTIAVVVIVFSFVVTFADFQVVYVLTRGGPHNSTHLFATLAYQLGMASGNLGEGAAVALFMFPFLALVIL